MKIIGKRRTALVGLLVAGLVAFADPAQAATYELLAQGRMGRTLDIRTFTSSRILTETIVFAPGVNTGWQATPGTKIVSVVAGELVMRDGSDNCAPHLFVAYNAPSSPWPAYFLVSGPHLLANAGAIPAQIVVTSILPGSADVLRSLAANRRTAPVPPPTGCSRSVSRAGGSEGGVGPTVVSTLSDATLPNPIDYTPPLNRHVTTERATYRAGDVGDWHTHPVAHLISVTEGHLLLHNGDCTPQVLGPGQAAFVPPDTPHRAQNTTGADAKFVFTTFGPGSRRVDPAPCAL